MRQRRWPRSRYVRVMGASLLVGFLVSLVSIPTRADERQDCDGTQALALVNGKIHTMDAKNSVVSSVLIRNGKFVEVGRRASDGDGRCTKTINLHGRTAVPGIIDNHNHIILLGLRPGHDTRLENANSIQEVLDTLAARAAGVPRGEWITAIGGFSRNQFFLADGVARFPTLSELDRVTPNHPVLLFEAFTGPSVTNTLGKAFFESKGVVVGSDGSIAAAIFGDPRGGPSLDALFELRKLQTRATWLLPRGPVASVTKTIEDAGGIIVKVDFGTRQLDAVSQWIPGMPPLFFVNGDLSGDRLRLSLAHELGHIVMHRTVNPDIEQQAFAFAAALLMPKDSILPTLDVVTPARLATLKPYWKVSMQAILKRAADLGAITERQARYVWMQLSAAAYRKREPAGLDIPVEEPRLLKEMVEMHAGKLGYSVEDLGKLLGLVESELRELYFPNAAGLRVVRGGRRAE